MNTLPTIALSVRQPWAALIVNGIKDIENRTWSTAFRGRVLIHASKTFGRAEKLAAEALVKKFNLERLITSGTLRGGGIVGAVSIIDCVQESKSEWFEPGCYGFVLRNPMMLPFQPMRGRLGFFNVDGDHSFSIREESL